MSDLGETPDRTLDAGVAREVRTVAKGGAIQIVGQVSQRGLSFFFQFIALAFVGRNLFGIYRQIIQVLAIAAQLGLAGFNYAAMRFITKARAENRPEGVKGAARAAITATTIASLAVAAGLLVFAAPLASLFADAPSEEPTFVRLFRIGAPYVVLFALLQVLRYCTQAYKTMTPSVIAGSVVQPIVRFALPQGGASLLGIQSLGLGVLIVGAYTTNVQVTLFSIALMLQGPGTVFLGGILNIWAPGVSDLHAKGEIERL
ncbi:MAG TPA: oligosaccharide flippase family protein, partial [Thermoanaerobaculia bacterium]|nr:oligosaccharide flippase family protein [Thermoanaerobaculia bacterium]